MKSRRDEIGTRCYSVTTIKQYCYITSLSGILIQQTMGIKNSSLYDGISPCRSTPKHGLHFVSPRLRYEGLGCVYRYFVPLGLKCRLYEVEGKKLTNSKLQSILYLLNSIEN